MDWKEWTNASDEFKRDSNQAHHFSLKGHPEFPSLNELSEEEVLETLSEFIKAEGKVPTIELLFAFAPVFEMTLQKQNIPSIFG